MFSVCVLGKTYTLRQIMPLSIITFSVFVFTLSKMKDEAGDANDNLLLGNVIGIAACCFAVFSFLLREMLMKKQKDVPFYIQQFQFNISMFFWHLLVCFVVVPLLGRALDAGGLTKGNLEKSQSFFTSVAVWQCRTDWDSRFAKLEEEFRTPALGTELAAEAAGTAGSEFAAPCPYKDYVEKLKGEYNDRLEGKSEDFTKWDTTLEKFQRVNLILRKNPFRVEKVEASLQELKDNLSLSVLQLSGGGKAAQAVFAVKGHYAKVLDLEYNGEGVFCRLDAFFEDPDRTEGRTDEEKKAAKEKTEKNGVACFVYFESAWFLVEPGGRETNDKAQEKELRKLIQQKVQVRGKERKYDYALLMPKDAAAAEKALQYLTPRPSDGATLPIATLRAGTAGRNEEGFLADDAPGAEDATGNKLTIDQNGVIVPARRLLRLDPSQTDLVIVEEDTKLTNLRNRFAFFDETTNNVESASGVLVMRGMFAPGNKGPGLCDFICDESLCSEKVTKRYPTALMGKA